MQELTSVAVWAVCSGVELYACLCLVVAWQVSFLVEFVIPMCEWALVLEFALSKEFPVPAHLSFVLHLIVSNEVISLLFSVEVLPWFLDGSLFEVFVRWFIAKYFVSMDLSLWGIVIIISDLSGSIWIVIERIFSGCLSALFCRNLQEVTLGAVLQ